MNKQEFIERMKSLKNLFGNKSEYVKIDFVIELASELDEPEAGHADEAPRYVKNILARLRELPLHDREVWLKAIMGEFEQDFSRAKWREGYEQGKVEGLIEREKVTVPQFVADWIEYAKFEDYHLLGAMDSIAISGRKDLDEWFRGDDDNMDIFARAWLDGYEVKKEKRYLVKMKSLGTNFSFLNLNKAHNHWMFSSKNECDIYQVRHTRKELEEAGFGWVFDCEGIEIEEVKE